MELLKPIEIEKESMSEDEYEEMLNETYGEVDVCGYKHEAGTLLKEIDPIAFHCGYLDSQEYTTVYKCPVCGDEHEDEEDALYCCQSEPDEDEGKE